MCPQIFKYLFRQWCQRENQHRFHSIVMLTEYFWKPDVEDMWLTGSLTVDPTSFWFGGRQRKTKGWILHSSGAQLLCMTAAVPTAVRGMRCLSEFIRLLEDHEACSGQWKALIPLHTKWPRLSPSLSLSLSLIHSSNSCLLSPCHVPGTLLGCNT